MRVTGGRYKNRALYVPEGNDVRPTSDRMRQTLFNLLHHAKWAQDFAFDNVHVLDIFCGSGALGIETLSHGAGHCTFIDMDVRPVQKNLSFVTPDTYSVMKSNATTTKFNGAPFDLVFMDPPYRKNLVTPTLDNLIKQGALREGAIVIIETEKHVLVNTDNGLTLLDKRTQSQSDLHVFRYR